MGRAAYLEKQVRGRLDLLLEQNTERPILLLEIENPCSQLQTLLPQILITGQTGCKNHTTGRITLRVYPLIYISMY